MHEIDWQRLERALEEVRKALPHKTAPQGMRARMVQDGSLVRSRSLEFRIRKLTEEIEHTIQRSHAK
jgi:hypothetical protein